MARGVQGGAAFKKSKRWAIVLAAALAGVGTFSARAVDFFDWLGESNAPNSAPYITAPTLNDSTAASVKAFLLAQPAGTALAVKVRAGTTLSAATIASIFNDPAHPIKYTFSDYEGPSAVAQTAALVAQIAPTATGAQIGLGNAFIGNYDIAPLPSDPTHPGSASRVAGNTQTQPFFTTTDFRNSGVNMSNESLYPGDASFRNPINGNSTAPNIRSAFFTLPIQRLTIATQNLGVGQLHIPYVSRFDNFTNPAFQNTTGTDIFGKTVMGWDTSASPSFNGQLLSRNDFEALLLHYRMRGATSYQLLDPGVQGYTKAQMDSDALAGWTNATVGSVLSGVNGRVASLPTTITVNGSLKSIEDAGAVWSAVTNDNPTPELEILVSNMDGASKTVSFNTRINGATLTFTTGLLAGGSHTLLHFTKSGGAWTSGTSTPVFNDAALASRDGIGIPEPASLSLLGVAAVGVLARRRRKA